MYSLLEEKKYYEVYYKYIIYRPIYFMIECFKSKHNNKEQFLNAKFSGNYQ